MPVNLPLGTNLSDLMAQGKMFAKGLPSTVESGLQYLGKNALNPQEPIGRGIGGAVSNAFLSPPGGLGWKAMGSGLAELGNQVGVGVKNVPGSPIPDVTFGDQGFEPRKSSATPLGGRPAPPRAANPNPALSAPPSMEMPDNGQPSGIAPGLSGETQTTLGDAARLGYLTSPQPGYYKVDRLGESPFYTNQQEALYEVLRKEQDKRRDYNTAMKDPGFGDLQGNMGPANSIQDLPNQPSPTPEQGGEDIQGKGFDWASLGPALGQVGRTLSRPGADRPYAQMGFDEQTDEMQKHEDLLRKEQMLQEQSQAENDLRSQEIGSRYDIAQMGNDADYERMMQDAVNKSQLIDQELRAKGDPNAPISDALAAAIGAPPGTPLREAVMFSEAQQTKAANAQRDAYTKYLQGQGQNLETDNRRQAIQEEIKSIQSNPFSVMDPAAQARIKQLQQELGKGMNIPPPNYQPAPAPPPAPEQPGMWDRFKGFFGGGPEAQPQGAQPPQPGQPQAQAGAPPGAKPPGQGMTPPPQPNPVPLEVFQATSKLPQDGATIVQQIFAQHGSDPATLKYKLQEFVRSSPPEYRQSVMEAIAPLIARM